MPRTELNTQNFSIFDLPIEIIQHILNFLTRRNQISFFQSCKAIYKNPQICSHLKQLSHDYRIYSKWNKETSISDEAKQVLKRWIDAPQDELHILFLVADAYLNGYGVAIDLEKAFDFLRRAILLFSKVEDKHTVSFEMLKKYASIFEKFFSMILEISKKFGLTSLNNNSVEEYRTFNLNSGLNRHNQMFDFICNFIVQLNFFVQMAGFLKDYLEIFEDFSKTEFSTANNKIGPSEQIIGVLKEIKVSDINDDLNKLEAWKFSIIQFFDESKFLSNKDFVEFHELFSSIKIKLNNFLTYINKRLKTETEYDFINLLHKMQELIESIFKCAESLTENIKLLEDSYSSIKQNEFIVENFESIFKTFTQSLFEMYRTLAARGDIEALESLIYIDEFGMGNIKPNPDNYKIHKKALDYKKEQQSKEHSKSKNCLIM